MTETVVYKKNVTFHAIIAWMMSAWVIFGFSGIIDNARAAEEATVKIGVLAKRGRQKCLDRWQATADYLTESLPEYQFAIVPLDFDELQDAVALGHVDFVLANSSYYVELEVAHGIERLATLHNRRLGGDVDVFGGVIFCLADHEDIDCLADLKGHSFMAVDYDSFGGWRMAWREMVEQGLDPRRDFRQLLYGGTHDAVVYAVLEGKVDAGTVRTDTLERMAREGKIDLADFKVLHDHNGSCQGFPFLHSTRLYPEWPIATVKHTPEILAQRVAVALLEMPADCPAAVDADVAGWSVPQNYQSVHECMNVLGIGPYARPNRISLSDVIRKYWYLILPALLAIVIMSILSAVLLKMYRRQHELRDKLAVELEEKKRTEQQLAASEWKHRAIVETAQDAIIAIDARSKISFWNAAADRIFGYTAEEVLGGNLLDLIVPPKYHYIKKAGMTAFTRSGNGPAVGKTLELSALNKAGQEFPIEISISGYRDKGGYCAIALVRDVSARKQAELEINRSRRIIDGSHNEIYVFDPRNFEFLQVNQGARNRIGYEPDQWSQKTFLDVSADFSEVTLRNLLKPLNEGRQEIIRYETRHRCADGRFYPVEVYIQAIPSEETDYVFALAMDITERRMVEKRVEQHKRYLEAINDIFQETMSVETMEGVARVCLQKAKDLTASFTGFWLEVKDDGRVEVLSFCTSYGQVCRLSEEEVKGLKQAMDRHGLWQSVMKQKKSLIDNRLGHVELLPGHNKFDHLLAVPMLDGDRIIGMLAVGNKLAEYDEADQRMLESLSVSTRVAMQRKQATLDLKQANHYQRTIIDTAATALFMVDNDLRIVEINEAVCHSLECTREELIGRHCYDLWKTTDCLHCSLRNPEMSDSICWRDSTLYTPDGRKLNIIKNAAVMRDERGQMAGGVISYIDVSDLVKAREAAEAATMAKSEFLANMSHEIRTPMTSIIGFADELIRADVTPSERLNAAQTIRRNGEHLLAIVNDILDLSKIEAGRMVLEEVSVEVNSLIMDTVNLMKVRTDAKNLKLQVQFKGALPERIHTDPTRLRQVLINLIGNAVKFTEEGGIRLVAEYVQENGQPPKLHFEIEDTGQGMSEEQKTHLFKPFSQADSSMSRRYGGTGLGLHLSRRIAQMLGGDIQLLSSRPGEGSVFRVTVDARPVDGRVIEKPIVQEPAQAAPSRGGDNDRRLAGYRLLLVEDGPDNQRLVSFILSREGAEVNVVENGQLAVDEVLRAVEAEEPYSLILMDMQMPVMDGYTATRSLRERGYDGPIVALTAHAMSGDREKCIDAGCDDYATKPINVDELVQTILTCSRELAGTGQ